MDTLEEQLVTFFKELDIYFYGRPDSNDAETVYYNSNIGAHYRPSETLVLNVMYDKKDKSIFAWMYSGILHQIVFDRYIVDNIEQVKFLLLNNAIITHYFPELLTKRPQ